MNRLFTAENHHEVLPFWSACRREKQKALTVLTLDHHTDVVRAFRDEQRHVPAEAWQESHQVTAAVRELRHDEHFDWALRAGIIREAFIVSHTCATVPADERLHVLCDPLWPEENELFRTPELYRSLADSVLETAYLFRQFGDLSRYGEFILDIDCDYILTAKALSPRDGTFFRSLIRQAAMVTVSLEKDWVRLLRFPGETLTSGEILQHLTSFF